MYDIVVSGPKKEIATNVARMNGLLSGMNNGLHLFDWIAITFVWAAFCME